MSVRSLDINVAIHGVDISDEVATNYIVGWIREATKAVLLGSQKDSFKFRNGFESDIEVEVNEYIGEYE